MGRIKIISNPYQKTVQYQSWNDGEDCWVEINQENNPNSQLLTGKLVEGFFPFHAREIVDIIVREYGNGSDPITIFFEGSEDEFLELKSACDNSSEELPVVILRSVIGLENARDILPKVKDLFRELSPLIHKDINEEIIQKDLDRFSEASDDVVPICVLGNYSSGKSTFINALIGYEILPSGTDPVTVRVYKISRSKHTDRATVGFSYDGSKTEITLKAEGAEASGAEETPIVKSIMQTLQDLSGESITYRVNQVMILINDYERGLNETKVSDLIEVSVPFADGVLNRTKHPFVIFDTPGSNSATNDRHLKVLKEAMANRTNGLPIFVCTPDSLDTKDNEALYTIIHEMKELDSRFTMIVVNKADNAGVQQQISEQDERDRILMQAVPRNLYSGGIFFVSSIIGLGAKTGGSFIDLYYEDVYDAQCLRYQNPENKHYRMLYRHNILPEQIKRASDELAEKQENLVYANSGLFSIESEIEEFAGKNSAYNKCYQSQMYLRKVIHLTNEEISRLKDKKLDLWNTVNEKLESDKAKLISELVEEAETKRDSCDLKYPEYMADYLDDGEDAFSEEDLRGQEKRFIKQYEEEKNYGAFEKDIKGSNDSIRDTLKSVPREMLDKGFDLTAAVETVKSAVTEVNEERRSIQESKKEQKQSRHEIDAQASQDLLKYVSEQYEEKLAEVHSLLEQQSQKYWSDNTELIRTQMAKLVAGAEVLTDDRRDELEQIIIQYDPISFDQTSAELLFNKDNFEKKLQLFNLVIWQSDHLKIGKIVQTYGSNIKTNVDRWYDAIKESHKKSAYNWIEILLNKIRDNVVAYNSNLSKQAEQLRDLENEISDYERRQLQLEQYSEKLTAMMDWKEV